MAAVQFAPSCGLREPGYDGSEACRDHAIKSGQARPPSGLQSAHPHWVELWVCVRSSSNRLEGARAGIVRRNDISETSGESGRREAAGPVTLSAGYEPLPAFPLKTINDNDTLRSMGMAIGNWLSVNEAAERLGLTTGRIRQLLIRQELPGKKLNAKAWVIDRRDVEKFARKTGRNAEFAAS